MKPDKKKYESRISDHLAVSYTHLDVYKRQVEVMATEISAAAIEVADRNAKQILGEEYPAILKIFNCNILPENNSDYGDEFSSEFDMMIANPPYIKKADFENLPEEVKEHEPREALVAGSAGTEVYSCLLYTSRCV